jgi:tRNA pseudouridine32 synthase / 23S rRNA pseudouridine746 synthase
MGQAAGGWEQLRGRAVYEDEAVLVLDKPAGIAVMGERHDTDLVRLAREAGLELFPVHRIDKVTSGAVLLARELRWHAGLTRQFARQTAGKAYLAITSPGGLPARGTIDLPLSVGRKNRVRVAAPRAAIVADPATGTWAVPAAEVFGQVRNYPSVTEFATLWQDGQHALVLARPVTGRRHQIRVHLAWIGYPIVGDPLFGAAGSPRACLHSWRLSFDAQWREGQRITAEARPDAAFWSPIADRLPAAGTDLLLGNARGQPPTP